MTILKKELTVPYSDPVALALRATSPGMASFAIPDHPHTCRECMFWGRKSFDQDRWGALKPKRCYKFTELTRKSGDAIPFNQIACRFFTANPAPPSIEREMEKPPQR